MRHFLELPSNLCEMLIISSHCHSASNSCLVQTVKIPHHWGCSKESIMINSKCGFHSSNIPGLVIIAPSVWSSCFSWLSPAQPLRPESYVTSSRAAFPDYPDRRYGSALRVPQFGWHLLWSSLCHIFSNFSVWITGFHNRLWASWA